MVSYRIQPFANDTFHFFPLLIFRFKPQQNATQTRKPKWNFQRKPTIITFSPYSSSSLHSSSTMHTVLGSRIGSHNPPAINPINNACKQPYSLSEVSGDPKLCSGVYPALFGPLWVIPVDLNLILNIVVLVIMLNPFRFFFSPIFFLIINFSDMMILDLIYSDHITSYYFIIICVY